MSLQSIKGVFTPVELDTHESDHPQRYWVKEQHTPFAKFS